MKKPDIDIRYDGLNLDEVIVKKPDMVHFEQMGENHIWCAITIGATRIIVEMTTRKAKIHYTATFDPAITKTTKEK